MTLKMAHKQDLKILQSLDQQIEKAGEIFTRSYDDHSYMDKWAKVAFRGVITIGRQDFRKGLNLPNGDSCLYIVSYRYPKQIAQKTRENSGQIS